MKRSLVTAISGACLFLGASESVTAIAQEQSDLKVCLSKDGQPSDECVSIDAAIYRVEYLRLDDTSRQRSSNVILKMSDLDFGFLKAHILDDEAAVEICIVDGANICPPERFENIVACITINMEAGSTCPEFPETDGRPGAFLELISNRG